jgi:hypothetical protein
MRDGYRSSTAENGKGAKRGAPDDDGTCGEEAAQTECTASNVGFDEQYNRLIVEKQELEKKLSKVERYAKKMKLKVTNSERALTEPEVCLTCTGCCMIVSLVSTHKTIW